MYLRPARGRLPPWAACPPARSPGRRSTNSTRRNPGRLKAPSSMRVTSSRAASRRASSGGASALEGERKRTLAPLTGGKGSHGHAEAPVPTHATNQTELTAPETGAAGLPAFSVVSYILVCFTHGDNTIINLFAPSLALCPLPSAPRPSSPRLRFPTPFTPCAWSGATFGSAPGATPMRARW